MVFGHLTAAPWEQFWLRLTLGSVGISSLLLTPAFLDTVLLSGKMGSLQVCHTAEYIPSLAKPTIIHGLYLIIDPSIIVIIVIWAAIDTEH